MSTEGDQQLADGAVAEGEVFTIKITLDHATSVAWLLQILESLGRDTPGTEVQPPSEAPPPPHEKPLPNDRSGPK